jgi:hypothetical protein
MREQLLQVLASEEGDETTRNDVVFRRFWARGQGQGKPLAVGPSAQPARVIDLAAARASRTRARS